MLNLKQKSNLEEINKTKKEFRVLKSNILNLTL